MKLYFCPECSSISSFDDLCSLCVLPLNSQAMSYMEELLKAVLPSDPFRVGKEREVYSI